MDVVNTIIKIVGESGLPKCLDPEKFQDSWDAHRYPPTNSLRDRVMTVLGFFHWLHQSHVRAPQIKPGVAYRELLTEELTGVAKDLGTQVFKLGVFEVLRVMKSSFYMKHDLRGNKRILRLDLVLEPRRKEPLDSVLAKLQGTLYTGDLPSQLRESWKKTSLKSKAKPKSALDTYNLLITQESNLKRLPLYVGGDSHINVVRAANQLLVLRIITQIPNDRTPWTTSSRRDLMIRSAFAKAFSKLKG